MTPVLAEVSIQIESQEGEAYKNELGASLYLETSARAGTNVDNAFTVLQILRETKVIT